MPGPGLTVKVLVLVGTFLLLRSAWAWLLASWVRLVSVWFLSWWGP